MAGARTFVVRFLADADQYKKGIKQVNDGMGGLKTQVSSLMPSFKTMAIAGAAAFGAVAAFAGKAVQSAMEDEKSQASLAAQLKRTFGEQQGLTDSVERYISVTQLRTGTSDTELRDSLGTLLRSTGDLTTSQNLLNVAQDVSAATGKDLASVSLALAKASLGQFTALGKLGIPLDESTKKSKDFGKVLETLQGQFGGAADAAADTFGGRLKIIRGQFGEIVETIGSALLPYLDKFAKFLVDKVAPAVQRVTTVIGQDGLIAGFQQLLFESGKSGTGLISVFEKIAIAAAETANVIYRGFYIAKAQIDLLVNPSAVISDLGKAFGSSAIDVDALKKSFASIAMPVNRFKTEIISADQAERMFNKTGKITADTFDGGGGGGVAKSVMTATAKLKIYTDALKSTNSAQKAFTAAQKASVQAGQSLTAANQGVADAEAALAKAVAGYGADSPEAKKAAKDLELAQRGLTRAGYAVEQSLFAVSDAEAALAKVRADPLSTPQAIREAEIDLAEAKLSSADAIDAQTDATVDLGTAQGTLNEKVSGALTDSETYKTLTEQLKDAKIDQAAATEAVTEAILDEADAFTVLKDSIEAAGKVAALYPKIVAANPMAGAAATIPATVTGNSTGFNPNGAGGLSPVINVNAGLISDPATLSQEIFDLLKAYGRLNGSDSFFGKVTL
jgi:hypothetical protein